MPKPPKTKTGLKKASAQRLAIAGRRRWVHKLLQQHYTMEKIAELVKVERTTIVKDKKAIAASLAEEHVDIKQIDLDDLDDMEREAIKQMDLWVDRVQTMWDVGDEDHGYPKSLEPAMKNAGAWYSKRLDIKRLKGKWLGYEVKEATPALEQTNNTISLTINMPDGTQDGKSVSFGEWAEGQFREVGKELEEGKK